MTIAFDLYRQANGSLNSRNWAGSVPTSGGTAALGWEAPQGFGVGLPLIITTNGALDFGAVGPNIVMLMDAADYALGRADGSEIRQGPAITSLAGGDFLIEADAALPAGKGWQMGSNAPGTRVSASFANNTRMFESQTYYYSAQNMANSRTEYAANGGAAWQMKPVWYGADGAYGNEGDPETSTSGTNFFMTRPGVNMSSGGNIRDYTYLSTNNAYTTYFNPQSSAADPGAPLNYPYPVPYTIETLIDQGSADGVTPDGLLDFYWSASNGLISHRGGASNLRLSASPSPKKIVNGFRYGSYYIGLDAAQDCHLLDAEFYSAVGDGAACRVVLSNNSDHFVSSKRTILWSTLWTNNRIELVQREGWFDLADLTGLNLNVMDADNSQIGNLSL